jgi:hypothetical protein
MFNETYYLKKRFYFILFLIVTAIFFIKLKFNQYTVKITNTLNSWRDRVETMSRSINLID